ncbi:MAG: pyridoxal phosphate-dependent aminotransferase [Candidatus Bathyarchaeota archaeon]|nr:pyridoxal phosphate-dependent aminotransferase [Candidatus Bathyarchaeota archaeon]
MLEISERTRNLGTENAFVVLKEVNDLLSKGYDIVNFCIGQPDFDTPEYIKEGAIKAIREGKTGYTPSAGIPELREAVAEFFSETRNIDVKPEWVVIANGAKPFIGYVILSVTDYGKGHEVLYPNPGFPIYESQIRAHGAIPVPLPLLERKGYAFDLDYLESHINENSRLLILNSPHNPTGSVLDKKTLEKIAEIVLNHDKLWVFSDEVYSRMVYDGEFYSIASIPEMMERTVIVDGASKTYAMTGWRIGFASNPKLADHLARWVTNTDSCAAHPNQYAALAALTGPQDDSRKMMMSFKKRRDLIVGGLNSIDGIKCLKPGGAFYVWPNVTEACKIVGAKDSEDLRRRLLYEAGVAVLSDIHFGHRNEGEGEHIRFSYATSEENIKEGLKRIKEYIEDHRIK